MKRQQFRLLRCRTRGVNAVEADTTLAFGRHTHDQFGVGLIERGAHKSASGRGMVEAGAGDIITVNPGEVHDGAPIGDGGRAWRILYLEPAVVAALAADIGDGRGAGACEFAHPALRDPQVASLFRDVYRAMTGDGSDSALQADEALVAPPVGATADPRRRAALAGGCRQWLFRSKPHDETVRAQLRHGARFARQGDRLRHPPAPLQFRSRPQGRRGARMPGCSSNSSSLP